MFRAFLGRGIGWVLLGVVVIALPIVLEWRDWPHGIHLPWWVFLAAAVVGIILALVPWLRVKSVGYRITNYRIDVERGLIGRTIDTLELWHVEDVRFRQSVIDRILGVGDITVLSHDDTNPSVTLVGLPNPKALFESIKQRIIAVKRQRGVVKMDTGS